MSAHKLLYHLFFFVFFLATTGCSENSTSGSAYGEICVGSDDCAEGLCLNLGAVSACSRSCSLEACPDGDSCLKVGAQYVCMPMASYGGKCANNSDCISGMCLNTGVGWICTQPGEPGAWVAFGALDKSAAPGRQR